MRTEILSPKQLFQKEVRYVIPPFQRPIRMVSGRPVGAVVGGRSEMLPNVTWKPWRDRATTK